MLFCFFFQYNPGRGLGCEVKFGDKDKKSFKKQFLEFTQARLSYASDQKVIKQNEFSF